MTKDRRQLNQAVQLFRWLQANDYPLDNKSCTRAMGIMNKLREPESALELFWWAVERSDLEAAEEEASALAASTQPAAPESSALRPTAHTFTTALKAAAISGDVAQGDRIWDLLHQRLYPVDLPLLTVYMQIAAAKGDWEGIKRALANGKDRVTSGRETADRLAPMFATAISAALKLGRSSEALGLYKQMKDVGVGPNNHTASAVMAACAKIGTEDALAFASGVFSEMADGGMKPDVASCTSFIRCLALKGNVRRAERVIEWMWGAKLHPNVATYTAFLAVLGHDGRKNGRRIKAVLEEMAQRGLTPNAYTYSTAIRALTHAPREAAAVYALWRSTLPLGASKGARKRAAAQLRQTGGVPAPEDAPLEDLWASENVSPQMVPGALMSVYLEHRMLRECLEVLGDATSLGVAPNTFMYNAVLDALGKLGQLEEAEEVFRKVSGAVPRDKAVEQSTLEYMVSVYSHNGKPDKVEGLLQRMQREGMEPSDFCYTMLVQAYDLAGDWRLALRVKRRLALMEKKASVYTYNALLAACERHGQYSRGLEVLDDMERDGVPPNSATRSLLAGIGSKGVEEINRQQSLTAAVGALGVAGAALLRMGIL